ncbi:MAG: hypothetical protein JRG89_12200 [Deltaproteobacteria bacterium]|nr:hypothetical protein [Deltaproteobacteria bacterium]
MTNPMRRNRAHAICRYCAVFCGVFVEIDDGQVVSPHGDKDNPSGHPLGETQRV